MISFVRKHAWIVFCFALAAILRIAWLEQYPTGLHFDEAWMGYNAFLLLKQGVNIYGQHWPIDVNILGDYVSAMNAYLLVPFVKLFGLRTFAIRFLPVLASLATLVLGSTVVFRLTKNSVITGIFAILFAVSPWNIIMSRASSIVILDAFFLLLFCCAYYLLWHHLLKNKVVKSTAIVAFFCFSYFFASVSYFTYFTSRLLVIPFGILIMMYSFITHGLSVKQLIIKYKRLVGVGILPILLYFIFPFLLMLQTPFALGRYAQTTIIESDLVRAKRFVDIAHAGEVGLPIPLTRLIYNKVTSNATMFLKHYLTFLSPNTILFQTTPPKRYLVQNVGVVTTLEYVGLIAAIGIILLKHKHQDSFPKETLLFLSLFLLALVPTALTTDDFPNLQRGVIATPLLQMAAAIGLYQLTQSFRIHKPILIIGGVALLLTVPSLVLGYAVQTPKESPYLRNVHTTRISEWINAQPPSTAMLIEHKDATFLYPYFYSGDNLLSYPIEKNDPTFVNASLLTIGPRTFIQDLCNKNASHLLTQEYQYLILETHDGCKKPWWFTQVFSAKFDTGEEGFAVLKPEERTKEMYKNRYTSAKSLEEKTQVIQEAISPYLPP